MSENREKKTAIFTDRGDTPEIPAGFLDPNTKLLMKHPVLSADGFSYEKSTLTAAEQKQYIPNITLKKAYDEYAKLPPIPVSQHIQTFLAQELQIFELQLTLERLLAEQCDVSLSVGSQQNMKKTSLVDDKRVASHSTQQHFDTAIPKDKKINTPDHDPLDAKPLFVRAEAYYQRYNFSSAIPLLLKAAQEKYLPALSLLWEIYNYEKFYFKEDISVACVDKQNHIKSNIYLDLIIHNINDYRQLAAKDPIAMHYLGVCYALGHGFYPNLKKALAWYELSAKHNYGTALYELSKHYESTDAEKAQEFSRRSADNGCMFAILSNFKAGLNSPLEQWVFSSKHLNYLYFSVKDLLDNIKIYAAEKIKVQFYLLNLIAIDRHPLAENLLARWYIEQEINPLKAIYWSYRAADRGQQESKKRLTLLLSQYPQYVSLIHPGLLQSTAKPPYPAKSIINRSPKFIQKKNKFSTLSSTLCPITRESIVYPYVTELGHSYEAKPIATWLHQHKRDPMTNVPIRHGLIDNAALSQVMATFKLRTCLPSYIEQQNVQLGALQKEITWRKRQLQEQLAMFKVASEVSPLKVFEI